MGRTLILEHQQKAIAKLTLFFEADQKTVVYRLQPLSTALELATALVMLGDLSRTPDPSLLLRSENGEDVLRDEEFALRPAMLMTVYRMPPPEPQRSGWLQRVSAAFKKH